MLLVLATKYTYIGDSDEYERHAKETIEYAEHAALERDRHEIAVANGSEQGAGKEDR